MTTMTAPSLAEWIEDAAEYLCNRGYIDPDAEDWPDDLVAELTALAEAGPCEECPGWGNPSPLADHWVAMKQREYERSLPTWACDCGAVYKVLPIWGGREDFYQTCDDGLLGDRAGGITRNSKGRVKSSDNCPGCGKSFADTITDRANPQQALF